MSKYLYNALSIRSYSYLYWCKSANSNSTELCIRNRLRYYNYN